MPNLLEALAGGLRQAGGVLNPQVQQETFQADERTNQMRMQQQQRMQEIQQQFLMQQATPQAQMQLEALKNEKSFREAAAQANGDPEKIAAAAMQFGKPEIAVSLHKAAEDRVMRLQMAKDANDQKTTQLEMMQSNQNLNREQQAAIAKQADETKRQGLQLQAEIAKMGDSTRRMIAAMRPAPAEQPLEAIQGPDGKAILVPRSSAIGKTPVSRTSTPDRVIPAPIVKGYTENSRSLRKIDAAVAEVDANPESFGLQNLRGDAINQRYDPKGVTGRALVSDIGSLKIHDRSGAAVTAAETPRLMPFIPSVTDNAATIKKKLAQFKTEYEGIQNDLNSIYSPDQGYKSFPAASAGASGEWSIKKKP